LCSWAWHVAQAFAPTWLAAIGGGGGNGAGTEPRIAHQAAPPATSAAALAKAKIVLQRRWRDFRAAVGDFAPCDAIDASAS